MAAPARLRRLLNESRDDLVEQDRAEAYASARRTSLNRSRTGDRLYTGIICIGPASIPLRRIPNKAAGWL